MHTSPARAPRPRTVASACVLLFLFLLGGCAGPGSSEETSDADSTEVQPEPPPQPLTFGEAADVHGMAVTVVEWTEIRDISEGNIAVTFILEATAHEPGRSAPLFGLYCPNAEFADDAVSTGPVLGPEAFQAARFPVGETVSATGSYLWPTRASDAPYPTRPVICDEAYVRATNPDRSTVLAQWSITEELLSLVNQHIRD